MKNIVIFGGGLHANMCSDIIEKEGKYKIIGIIDSIGDIGEVRYGYVIIGRQEDIVELKKKHKIYGGFIAIGDNNSRKIVRDLIISKITDFNFINAIHPSVIIGRNVKLGIGVVMSANVVVDTNCVVGDFCILTTAAQLNHDGYMGEFSSMFAGSITGGKVRIGKYSAITIGVTILDRINIGENTVVGSGSLVLQDLPDNVLAYGIPAKIIRTRDIGERFLKSL